MQTGQIPICPIFMRLGSPVGELFSNLCVLMTSSHTGQLSRRSGPIQMVASKTKKGAASGSGASSVSAGCSCTTAGCVGSTDSDPENESVRELCREAWNEEASRVVAASDHLLLCRFTKNSSVLVNFTNNYSFLFLFLKNCFCFCLEFQNNFTNIREIIREN